MALGQSELSKEANLLCGDAIVNYKTVQSLGNIDKMVEKYVSYLEPAHKLTNNE